MAENTEQDKLALAAGITLALLGKTIAGEIKWNKTVASARHRGAFSEYAIKYGLDVYACADEAYPFTLAYTPGTPDSGPACALFLTPVLCVSSGNSCWELYCSNPLMELHRAITTGKASYPLNLSEVLIRLGTPNHEDLLGET